MTEAALYARVSSDRQEQEDTIQSQLAELRDRVLEDGVTLIEEFIDEGYSRDDLMRPRLDRLRDLIAQGDFDRVYIQIPDRLASGYKLIYLFEEFQNAGVEVVFLKGSVDETPEGKLMLHVQGAMAEYERTKIAERTRRGKLYWARQGAMVGGHAPYGYNFIRRSDTRRARLEVHDYNASVVRQMYRWIVDDQLSTRMIAKRLSEQGYPTARGGRQWYPTTVDRMLRNPVYKGQFIYCKNESTMPSRRLTDDPYKQSRKTGKKPRPQNEWIVIPVPAIVDEATWDQSQVQLDQNARYSRRNNKRHSYLLKGLIKCHSCGATLTGQGSRDRRYYRCSKRDSNIFVSDQKCRSRYVHAEPLEQAVWDAVVEAMQHPEVLIAEHEKRLGDMGSIDALDAERKQLELALKRVKLQEDRVTSAYINEVMELERYGLEMDKLKGRRERLEKTLDETVLKQRQEADTRSAVAQLEQFCRRVSVGINAMGFDARQQLLRLVVERVQVKDGQVRVETIIPMGEDDVKLRTRRREPVEPPLYFTTFIDRIGISRYPRELPLRRPPQQPPTLYRD